MPIIQVDVVLYGGNTFPVGGRNQLLQSWHYPVIMGVFHKRQTNRSGMISLRYPPWWKMETFTMAGYPFTDDVPVKIRDLPAMFHFWTGETGG